MAQIFSSDFETGAYTNDGWATFDSAPTVSTAQAYSGTHSLQCDPLQSVLKTFASSQNKIYCRFRIFLSSLPDASAKVFVIKDADGNFAAQLRVRSTGDLQFVDFNGAFSDTSSVLSTGQWYTIEIGYNATTPSSTQYEARLNQASFSSHTADAQSADAHAASILTGLDIAGGDVTTGSIYVDQFAVNDNDYPDAPGLEVAEDSTDPSKFGWKQGVKIV